MTAQIEAIQRMQDYIAAHVTEDISIVQIAREAGYSPWYARRIFLSQVGITPADYLRKLRLRRSALQLRDQDVRVIDIAFESGFESVDGFQRAFLREFGCNPQTYAKHPIPLPLYTPYGVKFRHIQRRTEAMPINNIFLQTIDKPARKVIIKRGIAATEYCSYCNEVGCDVWGMLVSMCPASAEPVCLWLPAAYIKPGTSQYVQGVEVDKDYTSVVPEGFDIIDLPAAKYLMFQGEPFQEEDFELAIQNIWEAEKKYDPSVIGYTWDDTHPRIQLEPRGDRGYIELLAISPLVSKSR